MTKPELDACRIFSSFDEALINPENVYVLDLSGSSLDKIPKEIEQLKNLQRLVLSNNQIKELPDALFKLLKLQELDLEENRLSSLPSQIGDLVNLRKLNLTRTKIPSVPFEISKLIHLEQLNLSWNDLKPEGIIAVFKLKELRNLNLQRNLIDTLSPEIGGLINLQILNLNFNPLCSLPEEISMLSNLLEMDLGKNTDLVSLPNGFKKLIYLEFLNLNEVPLADSELQKLPDIDSQYIEY